MQFKNFIGNNRPKMDFKTAMALRKYGKNILWWAADQIENNFTPEEVIAGVEAAYKRGINPARSDDLYSLEMYMNAWDEENGWEES